MAIYFPCGIGLFQASNQRLLIISRKQTVLANGFFPAMKQHAHNIRLLTYLNGKWRARVWRYDFWLDVGLFIQVSPLLGTRGTNPECLIFTSGP